MRERGSGMISFIFFVIFTCCIVLQKTFFVTIASVTDKYL